MKTLGGIASFIVIVVILALVLAAIFSQPAFAMPLVEPQGEVKVIEEDGVVIPPTGTGKYYVCVDEANVYGSPNSNRIVRYTLPRGTEVNVRERAKGVPEEWGMIKATYWVRISDLCRSTDFPE